MKMSSPSGKRRPLSTPGYEPLLQASRKYFDEKPKPPPKPKPQLLKSSSATIMDTKLAATTNVSGGYFEPGGSAGNVGYCLSSVYKTKRTGSVYTKTDNTNLKSSEGRTRFSPKDSSRPPIASLPAKFRISFEERSQQNKSDSVRSEPATGVLVAISESDNSVSRRPPPPIPTSVNKRLSSPLPTTIAQSLQRQLDSSIKVSSLERNVLFDTSAALPGSSIRHLSSTSSIKSSSPVTFAQPPPRELEYIEREHTKNAFQYLDQFRHKGELCDATLLVNGKELKAHRVVLASCSQYFESMFIGEFAEPLDEPIMIEEISDDTLQTMVDFAYTSRIKLTEKNIYSVFEAADFLQFSGVRGACFKFFKQQINKSNCIRTWLFAKSHNCNELLDASLKHIECNFLDIVKGREFLELDQPDVVIDIVGQEDLAITAEEQVYEAVLVWIKNKLDIRMKHSLEVFKSVRFSSMSKDYLVYIVDNEPLIKEDPDLLQLVSCQFKMILLTLKFFFFKVNRCSRVTCDNYEGYSEKKS